MTGKSALATDVSKLQDYLDDLARETPALGEVIAAFRPLKAGQAHLRAILPELDSPLPEVDPVRLEQGVPLATVEDFLDCDSLSLPAYLEQAGGALLPCLKPSFPALGEDAENLQKVLGEKAGELAACLLELLAGRRDQLEAQAYQLGINPIGLEFMLREMVKPLLEKRGAALATRLEGHQWSQGTCPVCGSLPEMAYLQGEGGQRWLRCSLCAHHWRFSRTRCPICGNEDQDEMEYFFAQGRERERVDSCRACHTYLVTLDIRGLDQPPVWEAAALGLVHLDVLAQDRGLTPAAWCAWNQLG